jgi:hypothetical protein
VETGFPSAIAANKTPDRFVEAIRKLLMRKTDDSEPLGCPPICRLG